MPLSTRPWSTRDVVLAVSVAANLVLAGVVVGAGVRLAGADGRPDPREIEAPFDPRAGAAELSPEQRRAFREAFVGEGLRSAPLFRELRDARDAFDAAVRTDPFDADGARAALDRIRDASTQLQERSNEVMVDMLADMPAAERAQMLDAMRDRRLRFRRGGGDDRRDGPFEGLPGGLPGEPPIAPAEDGGPR